MEPENTAYFKIMHEYRWLFIFLFCWMMTYHVLLEKDMTLYVALCTEMVVIPLFTVIYTGVIGLIRRSPVKSSA